MSKLWAKLAPAAARLERGSSANDKVTAADVAAATHGLSWGPFLAGLTFLAGDSRQKPNLAMHLQTHCGCALTLAMAAVWEMSGGQLCQRCNGKGSLAPQVQCSACHGKRKVRPTAARLAEMVGVSRATWYRKTSREYEYVFSVLESWVAEAERHVARNIKKQ